MKKLSVLLLILVFLVPMACDKMKQESSADSSKEEAAPAAHASKIYTVIHHKVKDYAVWKAAFDGFAEVRKQAGETGYAVLQEDGDPNNVTVINNWETMEHAKAFVASDDLKKVMEEAGVMETPDIHILNELEMGASGK